VTRANTLAQYDSVQQSAAQTVAAAKTGTRVWIITEADSAFKKRDLFFAKAAGAGAR
jgi:hypothetical protein